MKTFLTIISIAVVLLCGNETKAKQIEKTILVQSGNKPPIYLNTGDISYLKSVCHNTTIVKALNTLTVIKNNDVASNILIIMANKK